MLIDRKLRDAYLLPRNGPTGLNARQERKLVALHGQWSRREILLWIKGVMQGNQGFAKGHAAERHFVECWSDGDYRNLGVASARLGRLEEDMFLKADAVLTLVSGTDIGIQVKTGWRLARDDAEYERVFRELLETRHVFLVHIWPFDPGALVREKTIRSLKRYAEFTGGKIDVPA